MQQVSLFAGVGAFELGGRENGVKTVLSCDNDKYACQVLRKQFPETEVIEGDVRDVNGRDIVSRYGRIHILTAGFPCQSFSIAGKRKGFTDLTRGTLFFEVIRLARELQPDYIILENVKGLLSHDAGKTLAIILLSLGELRYFPEYALLNSTDFGVPQNRERIFIVGHSGKGRTRKIFPVRQNDKLLEGEDGAEGRQSQAKNIAGTLKDNHNRADSTFVAVKRFKNKFEETGDESLCLDSNYHKGMDNRGERTAIKIKKAGNTSSHKTSQAGIIYDEEGLMGSLSAGSQGYSMGAVKVGTLRIHKEDKGFREMKSDVCPTIPARARNDGSGQPVIIQDVTRKKKDQNGKGYKDDEFYSLTTQAEMGVQHESRIRRLTPVECERLQSFPDNWTKYGIDEDGNEVELSDTQRYKQMGNSITVNVLREIYKTITREE